MRTQQNEIREDTMTGIPIEIPREAIASVAREVFEEIR